MSATPEGFHTITPYIAVSDANAAIKHYQDALGAELLMKMELPGTDKVMHSCLQIGSSKIFLCDENEGMPAPKDGEGGSLFYVYYEDIDDAHKKALAGGMHETMPPEDMFWGDRMSGLLDKFGHRWSLATHVRDVSSEEMAKAMDKMNC